MSLLKIKNLTVNFNTDSGQVKAVNNASIKINSGQTVALVGESGSGKSVTALSILRLLESVASVDLTGEIFFEDKNILSFDKQSIRKLRGNRISMIFQEPMTSLNPVYPIGNQLIEPFMLHQNLSNTEAKKQSILLLDKCGIPNPEQKFNSYPHQMSGGQRQRVMIAMALACKPSLLIADEPTTALDVTIQAQILCLIKSIQTEMDMSVLLITHDLTMVKQFADHVYIMNNGNIVESGSTQQIFNHPQTNYTNHLLESVPKGRPSAKEPGEPLVSVKNLKVHFSTNNSWFKKSKDFIKAVDDVSLTIKKGTTFGIVGESGSGKSTLGLSILKLINSKGEILYGDVNISKCSSRQMRKLRSDIQVVFQDPFSSLSPRLTIRQIISEGVSVHFPKKSRYEIDEVVNESLAEVGLSSEMAHRYPHEFSGGQRQRIAIARAIVLKPEFLVLDEPTSALDMTIQAQIIDLLKLLQKKYNMTYLFISHDLKVIKALVDEIAVMKDGKFVETGPAEQIFSNPQHQYTKTLFDAAFITQ